MAHEEATFSNQHSAVSEKQNQYQHQRLFTAEGAEDTHPNEPKPDSHPARQKTCLSGAPGSLGAPDAEESKTLPLSHGKPADEHERVKQRAQALALKLAQTYEELTRLLERNPAMKRQITEGESKEDKVYQKLKQRLKLADMAPRCQWVRQDGTSCRSPQMKQHIYCFAHKQMAEARELMLRLPPPEDANAIQVGLMRIQKSLIEDTISTKKAGLLLYSMQLALTNVGQTTFGQAKDEEMVRETVDEEVALSEKQTPTTETRRHGGEPGEGKTLPRVDADERGLESVVSRKQNLFTAKDAEKNQGLPLMNTDDTDFGEAGGKDGGGEVEFVPVPGGYGFERVRLRIEPEVGKQRRPVQPAITTEDPAQVHTSLLRDERLPKGPRFQPQHAQTPCVPRALASESLDADTGLGAVLQTEPYANLG